MDNMLESLYESCFGRKPEIIAPLTPAGSNRRYFRLTGEAQCVGVIGTSRNENESFIYLARHFASKGINVPQIYAVSDDSICYLQSDLGDISLFDVRHNVELLVKAVSTLPKLQYLGSEGLDYSKCYPVSDFDAQAVMWDLNYFKYSFLNTTGITYSEPRLEADFRKMADSLSVNNEKTFMYRDFQSRNVMVNNNDTYFIDFQGGRRGPAVYDVVSFVSQARASYPTEVKRRLIDAYIEAASQYTVIDRAGFDMLFREYSLLRTMQVLGTYGFRGRFERKPHFIKSIGPAVANLAELIKTPFEEYPYLTSLLYKICDREAPQITPIKTESNLTVTVSSFSYKKGIPEDKSGNGGGFVFDCRGMDNPGRYDEYKQLTGLDAPVIGFLESRGEIIPFLEHCQALVDASVKCYDNRGFSSLTVSFGCTGGQHRSVYSAQKTAEHIKERFPHVVVRLIHREQNIDRII